MEMRSKEIQEIGWLYKDINPMELTEEDEGHSEDMDVCHICGYEIIEILGMVKVRDHDHLIGTYRGPAHRTTM